jgi:uncharacterized protein (DUF362 family)
VNPSSPIPVALQACPSYNPGDLHQVVAQCCQALALPRLSGLHVLVKPNLVAARQARLSCTHPQVVRAVCLHLLEHGAKVAVGDSPAFGSARQVARASGLQELLADLPVSIQTLDKPVRRFLACGIELGVSRYALECDLLFNVPRLKAHAQFCISAAAKNVFGCVSGVRKALAHVRHGQNDDLAKIILDLPAVLPPTAHLLDAVIAMQGTGPVAGSPCGLGLLAASHTAVALDTAIYTALELEPEQVPFWRQARCRAMPGAFIEELDYPLLHPLALSLPSFATPRGLNPVSFHPRQVAKGLCRRAWLRMTEWGGRHWQAP